MIAVISGLLSASEAAEQRAALGEARWLDGRITAGPQSARAKSNLQLPQSDPIARDLGALILRRLGAHQGFITAALPARVFPPQFNRYDAGMGFGDHIDNAIRFAEETRQRYRTDLSCTLFLSDPADYDGGELVIAGSGGRQAIKLPAGDMALYPASTVHGVAPVTRGSRIASFFWIQSMVRSGEQRAVLRELDAAVSQIRAALGDDDPNVIRLTGVYHNLLRGWAEA